MPFLWLQIIKPIVPKNNINISHLKTYGPYEYLTTSTFHIDNDGKDDVLQAEWYLQVPLLLAYLQPHLRQTKASGKREKQGSRD